MFWTKRHEAEKKAVIAAVKDAAKAAEEARKTLKKGSDVLEDFLKDLRGEGKDADD